MGRSWLIGLWSCLLACGAPAPAQPPPKAATVIAPAQAPIPVESEPALPIDARIQHGKLPNGLTYYVLPHHMPAKRAQLWLAVNAGSVLEDDDQRGLAHFVEHMAFNGTKRFPKHALVDLLEKSGVRFGADLNASTSFDETVYKLQVPTDTPELVADAIRVLRDFADGVSFEPAELEKERGVVLEEWRLGRGAGMRLFDKQAKVLFHGSKYAERLPIGKTEIIQRASRDTLQRFYKDWYRPDLMAIVAVGDFEPAAMLGQITSEFASLAGAPAPRARPTYEVPKHAETLSTIDSDPEMPITMVAVSSKLSHRPERSAKDYRRMLAEQLFTSMLNARLDELRRKPGAPFLSAAVGASNFVRGADIFRYSATVPPDGIERGFHSLLEELTRVERHGFTEAELTRAKARLLRSMKQAVKERDKRDGQGFAAEIVRHFMKAEAMPGAEAELDLYGQWLPTYTLAELNQLGKTLTSGSRVISAYGPSQMVAPSSAALLATERAIERSEIAPYVEQAVGERLLNEPLKGGKVVATRTIAEVNVTEWTLDNGVRVVVRPSDFTNDEVRMSAVSPGGLSLVKEADLDSARVTTIVADQGGLGPFDAPSFRRFLSGKWLSIGARVDELEERVFGHAGLDDLELLLQATYLKFSAPRRDEPAFSAWRAREIERVRNRLLQPEIGFEEEMTKVATQNHPLRRPLTPEVLARVDLDKALAIYQQRFANAADFTFVFVGPFELERLKPLVEQYLGSLPTDRKREKWRDTKVYYPRGVKTFAVRKGSEPKTQVRFTFHGAEKWSRDGANDLRTLREALRLRLREVLREELGGVYGVQVSGWLSRRPHPEYTMHVSFGCAPGSADTLKQAVFTELLALSEHGISEDYIQKIKEARRRTQETDLRDDAHWQRELERAYTHGDDPRLILEATMLDKVTSDRLRAVAKKFAKSKEYVLGVLEPGVP